MAAAIIPALIGAAVTGGLGLLGHHERAQGARRVASAQREDAAQQRLDYYQQARDYTAAGRYRRSQQATAYAGSGVTFEGSPLTRLMQTRQRYEEGAGRLRERGDIALARGRRIADITQQNVGNPLLATAQGAASGFLAFGGADALGDLFSGGAAGASNPALGIGAPRPGSAGGGGRGFF